MIKEKESTEQSTGFRLIPRSLGLVLAKKQSQQGLESCK